MTLRTLSVQQDDRTCWILSLEDQMRSGTRKISVKYTWYCFPCSAGSSISPKRDDQTVINKSVLLCTINIILLFCASTGTYFWHAGKRYTLFELGELSYNSTLQSVLALTLFVVPDTRTYEE